MGWERNDGLAKAASNIFQVVVDDAFIIKYCLAGADQWGILQPRDVLITEGRIMESRMDDTASLLYFRVRCDVPNKPY